VESQQPEIVKILLEHGASANVKDEHQQTPLHLAVYHGLPEVAKVLVDAGAPVTAKDEVA
jgi:ankyrin repeat protein